MTVAPLDNYVCINCGYVESYIADSRKLKKIKEKFGSEVEIIVDCLTKIQHFGENGTNNDVEALRKILLSSAKDIRILMIKLCNRLHNMRTLKFHPKPEKRKRIAEETLNIYAPIADRL
mgnify:CR=1 FL=1